MKVDELLNDKTLAGLSLLLIFLWFGAKIRLYSLPKVDGTMAASALLRVVCGFLLAGASLDKLGDPAAFSAAIKECYDVVPAALVPLAAVVIPWLEFFTGFNLVTGFKWRGASVIFCALMILYTLAITWDLFRGIDCNCGCFKMDAVEKMTWWTVLRDLGFLGMGFIVLVSPRTYAGLDPSNGKKSFS